MGRRAMNNIMHLLEEISQEEKDLQDIFVTEEEQSEKIELVNQLDERMQAMAFYTIKNLMEYQLEGWKELILDEEE